MKDVERIEEWLRTLEPYEWFCFVQEWNDSDKKKDFAAYVYEVASRTAVPPEVEENASDVYHEYYSRFNNITWDFEAIETELLLIRLYHVYGGDVEAYRKESIVRNVCFNEEIVPRWQFFSGLNQYEQAQYTEQLIKNLGAIK